MHSEVAVAEPSGRKGARNRLLASWLAPPVVSFWFKHKRRFAAAALPPFRTDFGSEIQHLSA